MQSLRKAIRLNWRSLATGSLLSICVFWPLSADATHRPGHNTGGTQTPAPTVTTQQGIDFGTLTVVSTGTATINPSTGTRTTSGTVVAGGTSQRAQYLVTGTAGSNITITLPASVALKVGPSTVTYVPSVTQTTAQLNASGQYVLYVGGTATLSSTNRTGVHSGTLTVDVIYGP